MQKEEFNSELGEWYSRRLIEVGSSKKRIGQEQIITMINTLPECPKRILEIGCGTGWRLNELSEIYQCEGVGIDPSSHAIEAAKKTSTRISKLQFEVATADLLPFSENSFDLVFFGFSLFLCDRKDLFKIASEADRVLSDNGYLMILDFNTFKPLKRKFYNSKLFSYKMDYSKLFCWNPVYTLMSFTSLSHHSNRLCSDIDERIGLHLIKKELYQTWK
jgi:ubiquinone/menaquinone biosynthesis C-methylase UbiE